ncbi:MAG: YkgJ family cysteine cluster protein [Acidobacteriota bacterium]
MSTSSDHRFETPPGVAYDCLCCGDGCRSFNVPLGPGEPESLEALNWSGKHEALASVKPSVKLKTGGFGHRLSRREDGSCVFLGDDELCEIHRHHGMEAKPLACRLYPFGFYPVGKKVAVDVAFSCRAVREGHGRPVADRVPEWTAQLENARLKDGTTRHSLRKGQRLGPELLFELEHQLVAYLEDRSTSLLDRIRCCLRYCEMATTGRPDTEAAATLRRVMADGIPKMVGNEPVVGRMDDTQEAIFFQWTFLHVNPAPVDFDVLDAPKRQAIERERQLAAQAFRETDRKVWVDGRELTVSYAEVADVRWDDDVGAEILQRFFQARLIGQRFLFDRKGEMPFVEAVPKLFACYPMLGWTAMALAGHDGRDAVDKKDVLEALRVLDRSFGLVHASLLPKKQAKACNFVFLETDLVTAASAQLQGFPAPADDD